MWRTLRWTLACVAVVALQVGTASADQDDDDFGKRGFGKGRHGLIDPRICERHKLSEETQAFCDAIAGLRGRDLYKATVLENLRRTNQPPVADLELIRVLPRRVDLDASGSTDEDGFPDHYVFQLFDDDTGEPLSGPVTTRDHHASLETSQDLPANVRAVVIVEDDERATDTTELAIPLGATVKCSNVLFQCSTPAGQSNMTCTPTKANDQFSTDDLLDAAQRCDSTISKSTRLVITAGGGRGGWGGSFISSGGHGGRGGAARMGTTLAFLDSRYGSPAAGTTYCYGIGHIGGHHDTWNGAGGASTLLRRCQDVDQTDTRGVLLIAGGGGGGGSALLGIPGKDGGGGGIAHSDQSGPSSGQGGTAPFNAGGRGGSEGEGGIGEVRCPNDGPNPPPVPNGPAGANGIGGKGGHASWGTAAWAQGNPQVIGNAGQGADGVDGASGASGAGGGGWGGGGAGCVNQDIGGGNGGGGGGGSFADTSGTVSDAPSATPGAGYLQFSFQP